MDLQKSIRCQTDVALSITKHLFSKEEYQGKNLIFSPFSLHVVLSVMAAGSQGPTLDELLTFLRSDSVEGLTTFFSHLLDKAAAPSQSHCLAFANGMWVDKSLSISHSFKQLVITHYKATLASVDFQTKGVRRKVNSCVKKETNGLIKELLPPKIVDKLTRFIFANALCFKGVWKNKFDDPLYTSDSDFHLLNGTSVKVPFMTSEKKTQFVSAFDGFKVLRLSYRQGRDKKRRFSMYIFLPDAKDGLSSLIEKLASQSGFLKGKFPRRKVQVWNFQIPRFKISFTLEASKVLKELGVVSSFSQQDANFTKMVEVDSPLDGLYVENMFHKASIEVNEEGTKAAAANSMRGRKKCHIRPTGIDFEADHPFLFLIREDLTGTILFTGQVLNPLDEAATSVKEDLRTKYLLRPCNAEEEDESSEVPPKRRRSTKGEFKETPCQKLIDKKLKYKRRKNSLIQHLWTNLA